MCPLCRSCCSTRRTSRAGWWRSRMSVWTCVTVAWIECVVSLWSVARKWIHTHTHTWFKQLPAYLLYSCICHFYLSSNSSPVPPHLTLLPPPNPVHGVPRSPALLPLSRLTSVGRCSSWRRESILAGIPGATPTAATASCPSGPSEW